MIRVFFRDSPFCVKVPLGIKPRCVCVCVCWLLYPLFDRKSGARVKICLITFSPSSPPSNAARSSNLENIEVIKTEKTFSDKMEQCRPFIKLNHDVHEFISNSSEIDLLIFFTQAFYVSFHQNAARRIHHGGNQSQLENIFNYC